MSRMHVHNYAVVMALIMSIIYSACSHHSTIIPKEAGDNRGELERVLSYYEHRDTSRQKLNAAKFLIENMHWHYSRERDSIFSDAAILDSEFLIAHIDHAYNNWEKSPYAQGLSFDEFVEYLLPYRASQGFGCNVNAADRKQWLIEHIGLPDTINSLEGWIQHYNRSIRQLRIAGGKTNARYRSGLDDLLHEDFTDCADKAVQACLNLRAIGIPCVVEHNLGYRTFKAHHYHCAVWDAANKQWIKFDAEGIRDYPGVGDWTSPELLNLYRETYAPQPEAPYKNGAYMPHGFKTPCIKDVTHHIVSIQVPITKMPESPIPYLSTFHRESGGLQPFTYGTINKGEAQFAHVVPTVWYVVTAYPNGRETILSNPFLVNEDGSIVYLDFEGNKNETETISLTRKYPIKDRLVKRAQTLIGTTIVGANKPDFSDGRVLWTLNKLPEPKILNYPFLRVGAYQYYQLRTPSACEVSELEWLSNSQKIAAIDSSNKIYDGDMTTAPTDSTCITLILDVPKAITSVNLAPINADNAVKSGHRYELYRWVNKEGWQLHAAGRAASDSINFTNAPREALFWLKDATMGQEEMPMFYKDGKPHFIYDKSSTI